MSFTPHQETQDRALGALLGACIGDAAGAVLEFMGRKPTHEDVRSALTMPGGGVWGVSPGQITDDGELMLCLTQALIEAPYFSLDAIAQMYVRWYDSHPFDIGNTTRNALGALHHPYFAGLAQEQGIAAAINDAANSHNMGSKANGSLMRCMPLGVWGYRLELDTLANCAVQDAALTHPHPTCQFATAVYCIALAHLVRTPGDTEGAFALAASWLSQQEPDATIPALYHAAQQEVMLWMSEAAEGKLPAFQPLDGFVRIAWTHAFYHLQRRTPYEEALYTVLLGGGDTDTNACIVGGLLGAAYGAEALPMQMKEKVLQIPVHPRQPRPDFLHPHPLPRYCATLLEYAPTSV
jgi:ADP-ribosylglycohydrolase